MSDGEEKLKNKQSEETEQKRPGMIVELLDGRKGITYHNEPLGYDRLLIHLVDENLNPIIGENGKKLISCKKKKDVKPIGYID